MYLHSYVLSQTHPDFPKKPLTPYFRFFMEKRAKYAKIHPEMSNLDLTKILSKKYKELSEKKKVCLSVMHAWIQVFCRGDSVCHLDSV